MQVIALATEHRMLLAHDLDVQIRCWPTTGARPRPGPCSWMRTPLSTPGGTRNVTFRRVRTRPSPAHSGHGCGMVTPWPRQFGHGRAVMT